MKIISIVMGAAFVTLLSPVPASIAQVDNQDRDQYRSDESQAQSPRGWNSDSDRDGNQSWRQRHMERMMGERRRGENIAGGARFNFRRGDASIDVRCPASEDLRTCVEAATQLLRQVRNLQNSSVLPGTSGGNSPGSANPASPGFTPNKGGQD
ncbi:MAG TPA: hypothetical protein VHT68_09790 [Pseudolabrys sp.]|jgi:hypothetical protein|nr:hypothetical protein [Pseudolabrys sp.]